MLVSNSTQGFALINMYPKIEIDWNNIFDLPHTRCLLNERNCEYRIWMFYLKNVSMSDQNVKISHCVIMRVFFVFIVSWWFSLASAPYVHKWTYSGSTFRVWENTAFRSRSGSSKKNDPASCHNTMSAPQVHPSHMNHGATRRMKLTFSTANRETHDNLLVKIASVSPCVYDQPLFAKRKDVLLL